MIDRSPLVYFRRDDCPLSGKLKSGYQKRTRVYHEGLLTVVRGPYKVTMPTNARRVFMCYIIP